MNSTTECAILRQSQNLRQSLEMLLQLKPKQWQQQRVVDLIDRLHVSTKHVLDRLTLTNRYFVTEQMLSQLQKPTRRIVSSIQAIADMDLSDEPDYASTNENTDNLLVVASALPSINIRTTPEVLQRAAEQFDRTVTSSRAEVTENMDSIHSQLTNVHIQVEEALDSIRKLVSDSEETINQRVAEGESNTNQSLSNMRGTAEALLATAQSAVQRMDEEFTHIHGMFGKYEDQRQQEFTESQTERTESQNRRDEEFNIWLEAKRNETEILQEQARTMLAESAGNITAVQYANLRERQNEAADRWRRIGIWALAFSIVVGLGVFAYFTLQFPDSEFSAATIVGRYSVAFSSLILAAYALRQSGHHRQREEDIARVSNELLLLPPFINRLPPEEQDRLLEKITPLYFKGGLNAHDVGDRLGFITHVVDVVRGRTRTQ